MIAKGPSKIDQSPHRGFAGSRSRNGTETSATASPYQQQYSPRQNYEQQQGGATAGMVVGQQARPHPSLATLQVNHNPLASTSGDYFFFHKNSFEHSRSQCCKRLTDRPTFNIDLLSLLWEKRGTIFSENIPPPIY